MESFENPKLRLTALLRNIDNGKFFRRPVQVLYAIFGALSFVLPFSTIFGCIYLFDYLHIDYVSTLPKCFFYLGCMVAIIAGTLIAYLGYLYWQNRANRLDFEANEGGTAVAIPVCAHIVQSILESYGIFSTIACSIYAVIGYFFAYVPMLMSNELPFGSDDGFSALLSGLVATVLFIAGTFIFGFFSVIFAHYLGENMRIGAQIANDLRDVADIKRASLNNAD